MASPKRNPGYVGKQVLIGTPIEAVLAIVNFGIFSNLEQAGLTNPLFPWVVGLPLLENCLLIPANLLFSTILGVIVGWVCSKYIDWRSQLKTDFIWTRVNKNPQMGEFFIIFHVVMHTQIILFLELFLCCRCQYCRPGVCDVSAVLHQLFPLQQQLHPAVLWCVGGVCMFHHCL